MGAWQKEFQAILARLKREPGYAYFKAPVDPVELHIPLYPYLIRNPMDLGTVEAKLGSGAYADQAAAAIDALTCFNNALLFNGPASTGSAVYKAAKTMRGAFVKMLRTKFGSDPPRVGFGAEPSTVTAIPDEERVTLTKPNVAILVDMLTRLRGKYEKALEPFIYCVDPERYPDYYRKISDPIALSVVEAKLELYGYETFGHFAADVRRIWSNCQLYNGHDKLSRQAGKIAAKFEKYLGNALADMRSIVVIDDGPAKKAAATKVVLPVSLPVGNRSEPPAAPEPAPSAPEPKSESAPDRITATEEVKQEVKQEPSITLKLALPSRPPFNKAACLNIVNKLIKDKRSQLFRDPVPDSVLGYGDVIRRPMDLKTVRGNVQAGRYESNDDFVADVAQIWENCRTFNGASPITDIANVLATKFERDLLPLLNMPEGAAESTPSKPRAPPASTKSKPSKAKVQPVVAPETPVKSEPAVSPAAVYSAPLLPSIPIPPTAADASLICNPSQPMTRTSSRLCSTILRSVISLDLSGDFMDPLDPAMYNYHGYDDYVKRRMDLKSVRRNLDTDRYPTPNDFLDDLNLVFLNALAYPGTPLLTKIAARYIYLHVETGFLEAFPGPNAKQNLKQPWVTAARTALNEVSGYDFGRLFAEPVNPIVFNLLEYYDRVEKPRDLLTVTRRLNAGVYSAASEFLVDVDLIWSNCCLYHGDANPDLTDVAVNCRTVFLESFDRALSGVSTSESTSTELTSLPPVTAEATVAPPKSTAKRPAPTSTVHLIRRLKKMDTQQVFHFPVDLTLYPEYKDFVEKPMDLGTIETKLLDGGYAKAEEYIADVRLVFLNCAAYNAEGTPIRLLGNRISAVFESHLEKTDIQASLDEIRAKLEQKREEKLRREKEKEEKKVALQQKAAKQGAESAAKRKASPGGPGAPEKKAKTDQSKSRKLLPPLPTKVSDELVFKTLPPRIPLPAAVRSRLLPMIHAHISSLKLVPKSMVPMNQKNDTKADGTDKRRNEAAVFLPKGSNGIKFRLDTKRKSKLGPRKPALLPPAPAIGFGPDQDGMEIDEDVVNQWDTKVQTWLETIQGGATGHFACPAR